VERWRGSGGWVKEVGDSANRLMPFRVEFELTSIFGRFYPPSTRHQPTYPCHRYGFFWGTKFCTPTRTPEKPVAKPVQFPGKNSILLSSDFTPLVGFYYYSSPLSVSHIPSVIPRVYTWTPILLLLYSHTYPSRSPLSHYYHSRLRVS